MNDDRDHVRALAALLKRHGHASVHLGYREAEDACARLAARLVGEIGGERLATFRLAAIPRGGLIVLGMLAYHLEVPASWLAGPAGDGPLLLVDDCALTGARLAGALSRTSAREVVFAHLASPPGFRRAVVGAEPRVRACVAALDLPEIVPGEGAGVVAGTWRERLGPGRYWYGLAAPISFAWSEPDHSVWNPLRGELEPGWRFAPPDLCLANRRALGPTAEGGGPRAWRAPRHLAYAWRDGALWLCRTDTEEVFSLSGVAADVWRGLAGTGRVAPTVELLAGAWDAPVERLEADVRVFAAELEGSGLIERVTGEGA